VLRRTLISSETLFETYTIFGRSGYGIDAKLFDWSDEITADCPRKRPLHLPFG
jgi:hypothetical protein